MIFSQLTIGSFTMFGMPASSFTDGPLLLGPVFLLSSATPHAEIAWKLCEAFLLTKEEVDHFQVHTNDPVVLMISE